MKTFTYKDYENCYFRVGSYAADNKAMAISIENLEDGPIATCTVYDIYSAYSLINTDILKEYSKVWKYNV